MSAFSFLGSELVTRSGTKAVSEVLAGKEHVLLYFSASWCPPCQRFTPALAEFYKKHHEAKKFEIVFVSADRDEASMKEYYEAKMPFAAIPFGSDARTSPLTQKHAGDGIPDLVIYNKDGEMVTAGAVAKVGGDPEGANFPWLPPTWAECIPSTLLKKDGSVVSKDELQGKTIGVYCSAHWCPPCRKFTPALAEFYEAYKKLDPAFEIIFCSSDKSKAEMESYFKESHGDYLSIDYDAPAREKLKAFVDADGIPTFAVYTPEGKLINKGGRGRVDAGAADVKKEGWAPPVLGDLATGTDAAGSDLNSTMSVLVNVEGCDDDEQSDVEKALTALAKEYVAAGDGTPEVIFFISKAANDISKRIGELTKKGGGKKWSGAGNDPALLVVNISDKGAFHESDETDITPEKVKSFLGKVKDGSATRLQL